MPPSSDPSPPFEALLMPNTPSCKVSSSCQSEVIFYLQVRGKVVLLQAVHSFVEASVGCHKGEHLGIVSMGTR